jgi:hypothetical protein
MRLRRRHSDARSWPSGLAEVELFAFWERDLAGDAPEQPPPPEEGTVQGPSAVPLGVAAGLVVLVLAIVLLLG